MKRFFDLSLLLLIPFFLIGTLSTDKPSIDSEVSDQAKEIYTLIDGQLEVTLLEIQEAIDGVDSKEVALMAPCDLPCLPSTANPCCYPIEVWNLAVEEFGCYWPAGECTRPCLDINGSRYIDITDLIFISSHFCGS